MCFLLLWRRMPSPCTSGFMKYKAGPTPIGQRDFEDEVLAGLKPAPNLCWRAASMALSLRRPDCRRKSSSCQWLGDQTHVASELAGKTVVSVSHERQKLKSAHRLHSRSPPAIFISSIRFSRAIAHGGKRA